MPHQPRAYAAALALTAAVALGSCSPAESGDDTRQGPTDSSSSAAPSATPSPSVAPATGDRLDATWYTVNAPTGWRRNPAAYAQLLSVIAHPPTTPARPDASTLEAQKMPEPYSQVRTPQAQARASIEGLRANYRVRGATVEEPLEAAGLTLARVSARVTERTVTEAKGRQFDLVQVAADLGRSQTVRLTFTFDPSRYTAAQRDQVVRSVVATLRLTGRTS